LTINDRKFGGHAAEIIDNCFAQNEELALQILTTRSELYFGNSPLELAEEVSCRSFLSTKCVRKHMDRLWYGDIDEHGHGQLFIDFLVNHSSFNFFKIQCFQNYRY
jgi:hypothetical protein